jgi:hypothetical protein
MIPGQCGGDLIFHKSSLKNYKRLADFLLHIQKLNL